MLVSHCLVFVSFSYGLSSKFRPLRLVQESHLILLLPFSLLEFFSFYLSRLSWLTYSVAIYLSVCLFSVEKLLNLSWIDSCYRILFPFWLLTSRHVIVWVVPSLCILGVLLVESSLSISWYSPSVFDSTRWFADYNPYPAVAHTRNKVLVFADQPDRAPTCNIWWRVPYPISQQVLKQLRLIDWLI